MRKSRKAEAKAETDTTRLFWMQVADWYRRHEEYVSNRENGLSCVLMSRELTGSHWDSHWYKHLRLIWRYWDERHKGNIDYPAGYGYLLPWGDSSDGNRRREFCAWMADTIEDWLDHGTMPWENVE